LIWYSEEDGPFIQKPTGKGERLIIVNAISSNGWVNGAKLVFQANRKTGAWSDECTVISEMVSRIKFF